VLKGNKNPEALKAIQKAQKEAGVYQMDWIDANMLSGIGTGVRNFTNTSLVRLENSTLGRIGGGYSGRGAKLGNKIGNRSVVTDFKARNALDENILSKSVKQWSTTMNTLGEGNINAVGHARAAHYYKNMLKKQGVSGDQLERDVEVMLHSDPDNAVEHYMEWALNENALSGMYHSRKIEESLTDWIGGKGGGKLTQNLAKAAVRLTVGYPTVIGRSLWGGAKRATLGLPDLAMAGKAFAKGDKLALSDALYSAKVYAGSGAVLYTLGAALAGAGIITPSYPDDPAERERWEAEGIKPNSIKIGGQYFSIPGYFGALALPLVIPANLQGKTTPEGLWKGTVGALSELSPSASLQAFAAGLEGRKGDQWVKNQLTSLTRAFTPVGALLNQIAKMTDSTQNDTTTKSAINNLLDSIAGGIPGLNNKVNTIDKMDSYGNVLHNPNPIATLLGANGSEQQQGVEDVKEEQQVNNLTYGGLREIGVLENESLMGLVDAKLRAQMEKGMEMKPEQIKDIQKAVTKGIGDGTSPGSDSVWRQNGDYASDRMAMQVKLQMLEADPLSKPSKIEDLKTQLNRTKVLEDNGIEYKDLQKYQGTTINEWRAMGNPDSDDYDSDMYQKLWDLDNLFTQAGGSYKEGEPTENKYSAKKSGSGRGGSGPKGISTEFGTLGNSGVFAPRVRQYETISTSDTANIPVVNVVRPNIVHEIKQG